MRVAYETFQDRVELIGEDEICQEYHDHGNKINDWEEYANLGFLGALNNFNQGDLPEALSIYANMLGQYDGIGFHDKAFSELYETYKLALALYVGAKIQAPNPYREQMLSTLQSMQDSNGGFRTHYRDLQTPEGDSNTETSSLALLALEASGCRLP